MPSLFPAARIRLASRTGRATPCDVGRRDSGPGDLPVFSEQVLKWRKGAGLDAAERNRIDSSVVEVRTFGAREVIVRAGQTLDVSLLLIHGLMSRHVDDRDGVRQMVSVHVPGDFVDLHAFPLKTLDHDVGTLTSVCAAIVPHRALAQIVEDAPELARKLWYATLLDAAMHRKWVYRLGRLSAHQRLAHFFCETNLRMAAVNLSDKRRFVLPLTQADLGEICGLTAIHVNRVIRDLREWSLVTFRASVVEIHDLPGLTELGAFEPAYLYFEDDFLRGFDKTTTADGHAAAPDDS